MEEETTSVLFVCTGNICRSPYAELLGRKLYPEPPLRLASAGVGALVGAGLDADMRTELERREVPHDGFEARQLEPPLVEDADLVLTASARQRQIVLRESPEAVWRVYVLGQFLRIVERLPTSLSGRDLVRALRTVQLPPAPEDDVPDPRGRGPRAAARVAARLDDHVRITLGRLVGDSG